MKLYSKNQVILCTIAGAILAVLLTSAVFRFFSQTKNNSADASGISAASTESPEETELAVFETASVKQTVRPVSNDITYTQDELQNISVYDACNGAVVNINTKVTAINWFLEPIVEDGGSGSGSIIDKRGYVLTNVHVIKGATKIYVSLSDGTQYEATVVGQDEDSDLAVIKFTPPEGTVLQTISFGDSTKLKVGQKVIAIGNPFGFDRTMTTGIVSALGRPIKNSSNRIIRNMIQTDSAINPGNSGGPLLDTSGKMIGINTMIYSSSGNSAGVGFAVPAETAVRVASDLLKYGRVRRGVIEVSLVQLNNTIANYANLDIAKGVLVSRATKGGNADAAGIIEGTQAARYGNTIIYLGGDIITKIDNISVTSIADYYSALESKRPGDVVNVTVHRNGKDRTVSIRLADPSYKDKPAATYGI
ncbi:trypsin-like peptidase domain-containing protein [Treponema porcinum]|uniref:trypsin-like peptidase domain-containing protein n=1 Tax=Treponema porcinum TaxID=261392 RepID=UPI002353406F|nr:trypsin-like peptidase domain-containing protein [Treponema porcinum]MCI5644740.1 trypsin-like peptidase domain-containing protein [Treponema porcinum]MDY4467363.1 trypsin-like peptidase domain-containing protein [Treponema porcinum]